MSRLIVCFSVVLGLLCASSAFATERLRLAVVDDHCAVQQVQAVQFVQQPVVLQQVQHIQAVQFVQAQHVAPVVLRQAVVQHRANVVAPVVLQQRVAPVVVRRPAGVRLNFRIGR